MSTSLILVLGLVAVVLTFSLLALRLRPQRGTRGTIGDELVEIKASIIFWNAAWPALLALFSVLGFAGYDDILTTVSNEIKEDYKGTINKAVIDSLVADIKKMHKQSGVDKEAIADLHVKATLHSQNVDAILKSTQANAGEIAAIFIHALPKGTIIPYLGLSYNFDKTMWALCDGSNGTPDLRGRFILGSAFDNIGSEGGELQHEHVLKLDLDGTVTKKNVIENKNFNGPSAGVVPFKTEKHEHVFNMTKEKGAIGTADNFPPFVRLVYLMKIK